MSDQRQPRTVRLPFEFGDVVYHRVCRERNPGMVVGFIVERGQIQTRVAWEDRSETLHQFFELTTEFTPSFEA
ncbi:MAG: hypothetical protein ACLQVF_27555 [Isosphaeraceae bacterium]